MNDAEAKEQAAEHLDKTVGGKSSGFKVKRVEHPFEGLRFVHTEIWGEHDDSHDSIIVVIDDEEVIDSGPNEEMRDEYDPTRVIPYSARKAALNEVYAILGTSAGLSSEIRSNYDEGESPHIIVKVDHLPSEKTYGVVLKGKEDVHILDPEFRTIEVDEYEEIKSDWL